LFIIYITKLANDDFYVIPLRQVVTLFKLLQALSFGTKTPIKIGNEINSDKFTLQSYSIA